MILSMILILEDRIATLHDPSHRFKVNKTAIQDGLTGISLVHPTFALVYAEGGQKGMRHYSRLLQHRVDWTQSADKRAASDDEGGGEGGKRGEGAREGD